MKVELVSITPDVEKVIEKAGRTSYQSFEKEGEGTEKSFIKMLLKRGHHSVLEHGWATFRIKGVSRALTHQLVRHRIASFTQKSQRYVDESNFSWITPPSISENPSALKIYEEFMQTAREVYRKLKEAGIKSQDARYVLPNATETEIVVTANMREWRHIIQLRGDPSSQWEIRRLAIEILKILKKHSPTIFCDMEIDEKEERVIIKPIE
jgi:thymidylate synthase (FAD)